MSLRLTPFRDPSWVGSWTIFYWAWWLAWSPFVGLFIARVSRVGARSANSCWAW